MKPNRARMPKEIAPQVQGKVLEALPNAHFKVEIIDEKFSNEGKKTILHCYISGKMRMHFIKILPGDTVTIELSPYDTKQGRIIFRSK